MSSTPRIQMVVRQFYPWVGGAERQAQQLSARLVELGLQVRVVTGWWRRNTRRREVIDGVPVYRNFTCWHMFDVPGLRKFSGYVYMATLAWYLWRERRRYDIIHVHLLSYPAWPAVLVGRWLGKKTIIKIANSGTQSDLLRMRQDDMLPGQRLMLPLTLQADRLIAISQEIIGELRAAGVPAERIEYIPNGVQVPPAPARRAPVAGEVSLIFLGRLVPSKGVATLLHALAQARAARPGLAWRLVVAGKGVLRAELERLAAKLDLAGAVQFTGPVDNVPSYLGQADIFVLPSLAEGLSNALLEAMAYGLPCIATRVGGTPELIQDGQTGLLVAPEDTAGLAAALVRLADDPALRETLGQQARQHVAAEFSLERIAQRYQALYAELGREARSPVTLSSTVTTR